MAGSDIYGVDVRGEYQVGSIINKYQVASIRYQVSFTILSNVIARNEAISMLYRANRRASNHLVLRRDCFVPRNDAGGKSKNIFHLQFSLNNQL